MSTQQQRQLDANLRQGQFDNGGDVQALRASLRELMAQVPVPPDVQQNPVEIGGVAGLEVTIQGNESDNVILYFHGGVYVICSATSSVPLVGDLVRRTGVKAITLEYRLVPEHPYPAAVEDARAAYDIGRHRHLCHEFSERSPQCLDISAGVELALAQVGIQLALLLCAHQYFSRLRVGWRVSR